MYIQSPNIAGCKYDIILIYESLFYSFQTPDETNKDKKSNNKWLYFGKLAMVAELNIQQIKQQLLIYLWIN